ncbi:unnamed protein product [Linum trigynum]|uniref:Uncharacterized protein n=1 Tax=Linum trigynum TaxID=586398 RepID=A0AAV2G863_9ROSI
MMQQASALYHRTRCSTIGTSAWTRGGRSLFLNILSISIPQSPFPVASVSKGSLSSELVIAISPTAPTSVFSGILFVDSARHSSPSSSSIELV